MSAVELSRPEWKEALRLSPEQEARMSVVQLAQQLLDLHIRKPFTTPDVYVMHGVEPDKRTDKEKAKKPYLPRFETYAQERGGAVSLLFEETPVSLYLNIGNVMYPKPQDSISVEFQRRVLIRNTCWLGIRCFQTDLQR